MEWWRWLLYGVVLLGVAAGTWALLSAWARCRALESQCEAAGRDAAKWYDRMMRQTREASAANDTVLALRQSVRRLEQEKNAMRAQGATCLAVAARDLRALADGLDGHAREHRAWLEADAEREKMAAVFRDLGKELGDGNIARAPGNLGIKWEDDYHTEDTREVEP